MEKFHWKELIFAAHSSSSPDTLEYKFKLPAASSSLSSSGYASTHTASLALSQSNDSTTDNTAGKFTLLLARHVKKLFFYYYYNNFFQIFPAARLEIPNPLCQAHPLLSPLWTTLSSSSSISSASTRRKFPSGAPAVNVRSSST